jgi:hypothetical protein
MAKWATIGAEVVPLQWAATAIERKSPRRNAAAQKNA